MRVVSTFFQPSSISHSVKCRLDESELEHLVVAKPNRLEVFALQPDGAKFQCNLEIWGVVSSLKVVHQTDRPDSLLITTESPDPLAILLEYVTEREGVGPCLREYSHLSLHSSFSRTMEDFEGAVVHPSGDVAVVATYVGKLKTLVLKGSKRKTIKAEFDCILTELNVLGLCFLPVLSQTYVLAILHRDYTGTLQLLARELSIQGQELSIEPSHIFPPVNITEEDSRTLVPIPASANTTAGIMVLGGKRILFFEISETALGDKGKGKEKNVKGRGRRKSSSTASSLGMSLEPQAQVDWPLSDLTACGLVDTDGSRILLGDKFGQLCILSLTRTAVEASLTLVRLGETSPAATITYLSSGVIFVGSHFGDSQVVQIMPSTDPMGEIQLDTLDTFKNIAPVMDAVLIDTENSGQPQIVTCSGAHNTGSLKVIRNGAEIEELAVVNDMVYAKRMWPLRLSYEARMDNILVISDLQSTRFYTLSNSKLGTIDELDRDTYPGFSQEHTLALSNVASIVLPADGKAGRTRYEDSQYVVQVTPTGVFLINLFTGMRDSTWNGESEIVAASVNASQIAIALQGHKLVILMVKDTELIELRSRVFDVGEISVVAINPYDPSLPFSNYVAVGFYETNTVSIVHTANLMCPFLPSISLPHLPVSLLLCQFGLGNTGHRRPAGCSKNHPTHLLIGLGDGNLHVYGLNIVDDVAAVGEPKLIPLGLTKPVFIAPFHSPGRDGADGQSVLACGRRPTVLYWDSGRLRHSPLVRKGICAACALNTEDFPSSIVLAATAERDGKVIATDLLIGRVRELQKLQIRTVPFGLDNPVSLAHHPQLKVLGVCCQRLQPHQVGEYPLESCSFKIIDDTTFEQLHHFPCDTDEEVTVVQTLSLSLESAGSAERKTYLVVGTQYYRPGETEAREGRILLFDARNPWLPESDESRPDNKAKNGKTGLATSFKVRGCVFAVAEVAGRLAAAINESVYVFRLKTVMESRTMPSTHPSDVELEEAARWTHNYIVSNLVSRDDRIYIGDTISSLSVVTWDDSAQTLQNVARDYAPLWPVAIETLDRDNIVGCNNDCNLFVYNVNAADKKLEQTGNYYLGDCVNKFLPKALISSPASKEGVRAGQMFLTSTGRISMIFELDRQLSLHMTALQRNLGHVLLGPGDIKHSKWRAPKNSRGVSDAIGEATGFLDGDFLGRFLDFDSASLEAEKSLKGTTDAEKLTVSFAEVVNVLEQLQTIN